MKKRLPLTEFQLKSILKEIGKDWAKHTKANYRVGEIFDFFQAQLGFSGQEPLAKNLCETPQFNLSLTLLRAYSKAADILDLPDECLKVVERAYIRECKLKPFIVSVPITDDKIALELTHSHSAMEDYRSNVDFFASLYDPTSTIVSCYASSEADALARAKHICEGPIHGAFFARMFLGEINPLEFVEYPDRSDTVFNDPFAFQLYFGCEIFVDRLRCWLNGLPKSVQNEFLTFMNQGHTHTTHIAENIVRRYREEKPDFDPYEPAVNV